MDYTYTPGGRLWTRTWARTGTGSARIVTTYGYGLSAGSWHGDLMSVQYANDPAVTPSTTYSYDRLGRRSQAVRNGITSNLSYDDVGEPLSESFTGGTLNGFSVTATYNNSLQRDSLSLGGLSGYSVSYGYDTAGRLWTVSQGGSVATYGYIDKSALVGQIGFAHNGTQRMTTTKQADLINRLQSVSSSASATLSYNYGYNNANQRTNVTLADSSYWVYSYDNLGQVTSGKKFWSDRTPVAGQQFEYVFDQIGNRTSAKTGGDASGANLHAQTYTPDFLNRYSSRTVPGYAQMLGTANASAHVTLWTAGPTYVQTSRKGDYFWGELQVNSGVNPVYAGMTNIALLKDGSNPDILTKSAGNVFVPGSTENFGYDLDGNLTSDSRWNYTWDAENRMIKVESLASAPAGSKRRLEFAYDYQGRRIWERITNLDTSAATEQRFLYDGWNLAAAVNGSAASIVESFVWGLDLSGSPQGAGGVGGLLKVTYNGTQTTNAFVACDGNGNVCAMADAANGSIIGQYEYGPFGEVIRATGPMAKANPFRFSTKYQDDETDLLYYGYRHYNPSTGRWLSRDPAEEEEGGPTLMAFVHNGPVGSWDYLGMCDPAGGQCGPDVTAPVTATLANIKTTFNSWSWDKKLSAATALYGPYARGAWGMDKITQLGFGSWLFNPPATQGSPSPCTTTVTYRGTCYQASDVNYLMWGAINKMCWRSVGHRISAVWSLTWAQYAAIAWKEAHHDPWRRVVGAVSFTRAGWQEGNLDLNFAERWLVQENSCAINRNNRASESSFRWQWWPNSVIWPLRPWPL